MPIKGGRLTAEERKLAEAYAVTGDRKFAAHAAGLSYGSGSVAKALQRPAVQAEIAKIQTDRLFNEALPAAVQCLISIATDERAAAGARVQASKVILDRTLGAEDAGRSKEPHEMTAEEIAQAIGRLEQVAAARAKPVEASTIVDLEPEKPDLFG